MTEPNSSQPENLCVICNRQGGEVIRLRNNSVIHIECTGVKFEKELQKIKVDIIDEKSEYQKIRHNYGIWGRIFGDPKEDQRVRLEQERINLLIKTLTDKKAHVERKKLDFFSAHQSSIDLAIRFWPTYPPDDYWQKFRSDCGSAANFKCTQCRRKANLETGHVHHKVPLSLGGLNELSNFEWLCRSCHEGRHHHSFSDQGDFAAPPPKPYREFNINQRIRLAKSLGRRLWIDYVDEDGRNTHRWVSIHEKIFEGPPGNRAWIKAYCHLRKEDRTFRVDRIRMAEVYGHKHT